MGQEVTQKVGQEQLHGLLFGDTVSWQAIVYDLINTEQLDPWDVDISLLANRYLEKVRLLEEANFFVSSKVLLAAALLLRIKSEIVLNDYIPAMDEILIITLPAGINSKQWREHSTAPNKLTSSTFFHFEVSNGSFETSSIPATFTRMSMVLNFCRILPNICRI